MVVIYTSGHQNNEENALLAFDFLIKESGFNVSTTDRTDVCKPLSIQVMWSACKCFTSPVKWHRSTTISLGVALIWVTYYERCISFEQSYINEWNTMDDLEFIRPDSPALFVEKPTERERTEHLIKARLQSIMMIHNLEKMWLLRISATNWRSNELQPERIQEFIDNGMLFIVGKIEKPSLIFDHLYLGSKCNASNMEEL